MSGVETLTVEDAQAQVARAETRNDRADAALSSALDESSAAEKELRAARRLLSAANRAAIEEAKKR